MTQIPEPTHGTKAAIDRYHEQRIEPPRRHLGCSTLGHHCDRWLWLSFRWAVQERFPGRMLRLFRRGQLEEDIIASDLRAIGCDLVTHDENGKQLRVDFGNFVSGSMDGVIRSGVPESPSKPHVVEMKTHSLKSFKDLSSKGVEASKPMHWAQMQLYMLGTGIDRALYVAVCKDNDELHIERIRFDRQAAETLRDRGHWIVGTDRMPEPVHPDPSWWQCKFCPAYAACKQGEPVTAKNCRTCRYGTPVDGKWICGLYSAEVPKDVEPVGCESFQMHPDIEYMARR